jgi:ATP-dependent helicase/DNAse subunit B
MRDAIALYPTARKVEDWLKRHSRDRCLLGHRVMTFPQLVDQLWRGFGPRGAVLDDFQERLAVREAARPSDDKPGYVGRAADQVLGLIRQFKSAALAPADLRQAAQTLAGQAAARHLNRLTDIFEDYERLLSARKLCDRHDRERAVLDGLHQMERSGARPALLEGVEHLQIGEIYDFSMLQFMIVAALIRIVGDATITIQAAEHRSDATRFAELTWNRFVAEESIADKVLPEFVRRDGRPGRLGFVLENLFRESAAVPPPADDTLGVVEAPSRLGEIEEVGRAIRRAIGSPTPISPARIAVVARNLEPYADYLRNIFRRFGIPLCLGHASALRATPPARLLVEILRAPEKKKFERTALAALVRSPHLHKLTRNPREGRSLARVLNEVGYVDSDARPLSECFAQHCKDLEKAIDAAPSPGEHQRAEARLKRAEWARSTFEGLLDTLAPLAEPETALQLVERLQGALSTLGFDPASGAERADEASRAWGRVHAALDGLARYAELAPRRMIDLEEFAEMVEAALDGMTIAPDQQTGGAVQALPVLEARGLDFDLVFVIGLNDGVFPTYHPADPLLPDDTKLKLNPELGKALRRRYGANAPSHAGRILRTRHDRNGEDFLLFFLALSMPSRRAVLTYAAADANGEPLVRSQFIDEVLRLLGDETDASTTTRASAARVVPAAADCFSREEFLARAAADKTLNFPAAGIIADRTTLDSIVRRADVERRREKYLGLPTREEHDEPDESGMRYGCDPSKSASATVYDGRVSADAWLTRILTGSVETPRSWSPKKLDELASCGFRFFASRLLTLREDDEPDYEMIALEGGELLHEALHRIAEKIDFTDERIARARTDSVLRELYTERIALARDRGFFDLRWDAIRQTVDEFITSEILYRRANPGFELMTEHPVRFALPRGDRSKLAPLLMEGRIDRLELHPGGSRIREIRVFDYKNSRDEKKYKKAADPEGKEFGWTAFQLPVYLIGALSEFRDRLTPDVQLKAGYVVLRADKKNPPPDVARELVDPGLQARPKRKPDSPPITQRIIALVDQAMAGHFDVDPRRCEEWCPFRTVCRYYKTERA